MTRCHCHSHYHCDDHRGDDDDLTCTLHTAQYVGLPVHAQALQAQAAHKTVSPVPRGTAFCMTGCALSS